MSCRANLRANTSRKAFASGVALLLASVIAGFLWEQFGPAATFLAGVTALGLLALFLRRINPVK